MKLVSDKVVIPVATMEAADFKRLSEIKEILADREFPVFLIGGEQYKFDPKVIFDAISDITDSKEPVQLTVGDLQEMDGFVRSKGDERVGSVVPSVYSFISFEEEENKLGWPHPGVLPGITVMLGDRGAGKTTYLLDKMSLDVLIRLNEPTEHVDFATNVISAVSVTNAITTAIFLSAMGMNVAIDSFKSLVYSLKGPALPGGMSSGVFDLMTTVNNLVANFGSHFVVTLNPMSTDVDKIHRTYDLLAASATGAMFIQSFKVTSSTFRLFDKRVSDTGAFSTTGRLEEDSYELVGPKPQVDLPETIDPLTWSSASVKEPNDKPRPAGKLNF
jgi:hypothetical protein